MADAYRRSALRDALWQSVGASFAPFKFDGERCDHLVERMLARLQL